MGIIFSTAVKSYLKGNILLLALELDSVYAMGRVVNSVMSDSEVSDYRRPAPTG